MIQKIAHYDILKPIGAGGMGEVYLARDTRLERRVAVKVIGRAFLTDPTARARQLREARTASALNHPGICTVHDVGETEGQAYIVMEYVEGKPLGEFIPAGGMALEDLVGFGKQLADALDHAHERGIVHRDLKPSNVVVNREGRVKILDFGLARKLDVPEGDLTRTLETLTVDGSISGTLSYMAPEVLRGERADARSDIWAFGVLLHEMAAGELPFGGKTGFEISSAILTREPPPLPDRFPRALAAVVGRCLAKEPLDRFGRAGEVGAALEAANARPEAPAARTDPARPTEIRAVAVLPLDNLSGDPAQDFFADGMTESITSGMAKAGGLRVISRTSAMQYRKTTKPLPQIARELGVDAVVEGSVLRSGTRVRITAQLIEAATDEHLWAETYDRDVADILELQTEVSCAVVEAIQGKLTPREEVRLGRGKKVDPEVYEAYLKGRYCWEQRSTQSMRQGIDFYNQAIARDPTYAMAYVGIAECHNVMGFQGTSPPRDSFALAAAAARRALSLDPGLAEAHISLGYASLHYDWDWEKVRRSFEKGIELGPNYPTGHHWYALYFTCMGQKEKALAEIDKAWELDPLAPIIRTAVGWIRYFFGDLEAAVENYRKVLDLGPDFWAARQMLATAYAAMGRYEDSLTEVQAVLETSRRHPMLLGVMGQALGCAGRESEARGVLQELETRARSEYIRPYDRGIVHLGLGEMEKALDCLEAAHGERGNWLNYLRQDPSWDAARDEPRFQAVVEKIFKGA